MLNQLSEPPHIAEERDQLENQLTIMKAAIKVLQRDPDLHANVSVDGDLERDLAQEAMNARKRPPPQQQ